MEWKVGIIRTIGVRFMNEFLKSLRVQSEVFRSESIKKKSQWREAETEFKTIREKTDPLLKRVNMPERDPTGKRQERVGGRPPEVRRRKVVSRAIEIEPKNRVRAPYYVTNFKTEKFTAFKAHAQNTEIARTYPSPFTRRRT